MGADASILLVINFLFW